MKNKKQFYWLLKIHQLISLYIFYNQIIKYNHLNFTKRYLLYYSYKIESFIYT